MTSKKTQDLAEHVTHFDSVAAPDIVGTCPKCGSEYRSLQGGMACASCGLIESYRMIAIRAVTGHDTSMRTTKG